MCEYAALPSGICQEVGVSDEHSLALSTNITCYDQFALPYVGVEAPKDPRDSTTHVRGKRWALWTDVHPTA